MATMKAVVLRGPNEVRVEEVARPTEVGPTDALLRIDKAALCGTDLHAYDQSMPVEAGTIMGHEFVGTVVEIGSAVTQFEPGDKVAGACIVSCGTCALCRRGKSGNCPGMRVYGLGVSFGDLPGVHAEYAVTPFADVTLRKITNESKIEDLLFVGDILTTGYEAVRRSYRPGDAVAIVGAGPVGLCAAMSAVALGAGTVAVIDKVPERLAEAERFGAIGINANEVDPQDAVFDLTEWRGADVVVDAVGHPSALDTAIRVTSAGGSINVPGVYIQESLELPFGELWFKGISVKGGGCNLLQYMDEVMALIEAGRLAPSAMISHRMGLSEAEKAYDMFAKREAMKIIFDPSK
jgi:2-desacetyl-2-hydroxyethyl bacteriochlorophyllide A dehydrogenase